LTCVVVSPNFVDRPSQLRCHRGEPLRYERGERVVQDVERSIDSSSRREASLRVGSHGGEAHARPATKVDRRDQRVAVDLSRSMWIRAGDRGSRIYKDRRGFDRTDLNRLVGAGCDTIVACVARTHLEHDRRADHALGLGSQ